MRKLKNEELDRLSVDQFKESPKNPVCLILDNVRSLNNVGAAFRTGDAFRVEKIFLCGITGTPPHRDIQKTALGATESVSWEYYPDILTLLPHLKTEGWLLIAIEQADQSISLLDFSVDPKAKYAFIFGNEVFGVQESVVKTCQNCLEIPQFGTKHSLNISVSIGVVLWDFISKYHRHP
ncbi:MAG: RNA methyltransferase [Microscillaceae bacterium]|nr:RNA methyltransferase [Microscillaceae bacterium]